MESKHVHENTSEKDTDLLQRMTDPITSFPGKPPTPAELEVIKKMIAFFNKEKS
jgi:hypothetical protein